MGFYDIAKRLAKKAEQEEAAALARAENKAYSQVPEEAFNSPNFKVGETPVDPSDFGQAVSASEPIPPNFEMQGPKSSPVSPEQAMVPRGSTLPERGQSFSLDGEPYSKDFELVDAKPSGNFPAIRNTSLVDTKTPNFELHGDPYSNIGSGNFPEVSNFRDVTQIAPSKFPTGLALAGAGGLGLLGLLGSGSDGQPPVPLAAPGKQSPPMPAAEQPAPAPVAAKKPANIAANPVSSAKAPSEAKPGQTIDFGDRNINEAQTLKDAQDRQNSSVLVNQLGKAADIIGGAISHSGPKAQEAFDQNIKQAGTITEQAKEQLAAQKNDPNSPLSRGMKQFLKSFGYDVKGDASADELMKIYPMAEKYMQHLDTIKANKEIADQKSADRRLGYAQLNQRKSEAADTKKDAADTKRIDNLAKMLEPGMQSRSGVGQDYRNVAAIQNAKALLSGEQNLDNIDNRQISELARVLDRVLSGGNPTISGTEHLTPETAKMKIAKYLEFFGNKRQGAGAADFVNNIAHTLDREETTSLKRIQDVQGHVLSGYADLKDHPRVQSILAGQNLPVEFFDALADKQKGRTAAYDKVKALVNQGMSVEDAKKAVAIEGKKSTNNDMVDVRLPNGSTGKIPRANLEEAKKRVKGLQELQ